MKRGSELSRRLPLRALMACSAFTAYFAWTVTHWIFASNTYAETFGEIRKQAMISMAEFADVLVVNGQMGTLKNQLRLLQGRGEIDSYEVRAGATVLFSSDPPNLIPQMVFPEKNRLIKRDGIAYVLADLGKYELVLGSKVSAKDLAKRYFDHNISLLLRDLAIVSLIGAFIIHFFLHDILSLLSSLRSTRRDFSGIRTRSAEGETLLKGLTTLDLSLDELEAQNRQLRAQVLPALTSELSSGRKPPYEFDCTLVRVDINNFSSIFTSKPVEDFMQVINFFFEDVTDLVSRYKGYVYEFIGDEVIFYFKDEEVTDSRLTALAALRDIGAAAERMNARTLEELGYGFTVKSSLAHGKLRFGPQVNGFSLAGAILIETVRVLSQIDDKDGNVICFDESIARHVQPFVQCRAGKTVRLKGLDGDRRLYTYVSHPELESLLERLTPESSESLEFYRDDTHILTILSLLGQSANALDLKLFLSIIRRLRTFRLPKPSKAIRDAYYDLMSTLIQRCDAPGSGEDDFFRLSSAMTIAMHLLDEAGFDDRFKQLFKGCLQFNDRRVVANALDVLSVHAAFDDDSVFHQLLQHKDNRIMANALIKEGMRSLSSKVIKRTAKMIGSQDALFVASGLYVIGELARHHRSFNLVHYETNGSFLSLVASIRRFVGHSNQMVRRQALVAARKSQDSGLHEVIQNYYTETADSERKTEIETLYLGSKPSGSAWRDRRQRRAS